MTQISTTSRIIQSTLPSKSLVALPHRCVKRTLDAVGEAWTMQDTLGLSQPSFSRAQFTRTLKSQVRWAVSFVARSESDPQMAAEGTPASLKAAERLCACSIEAA